MEEGIVQVNFRMPLGLKEALERSAAAAGRSLTAEVVARLQQSFAALMEPELLALRVQYWEETTATRERALRVLTSSYESMAHMVIGLIESLPAKQQRDAGTQALLRLARAIVNKDGATIADSFADLLGGHDEAAVRELRQLRNELVHMTAAEAVPPGLNKEPAKPPNSPAKKRSK